MTTARAAARTPAAAVRRAPAEIHSAAAIVRRCLHDQRRSPLTWGVPLGLLSMLELAIFPSVHKSLNKALSSYPESLKQAFHIGTIRTPADFLNAEMFSLVIPLAIAFFAIRAATRPVAGYEERHWIDTVMTAPLRRQALVAGSFVSAAISSALVLLVTSAIIWVSGEAFGAVIDAGHVLAAAASMWSLALFFAGVGLFAAGRLANWSTVTAVGAGLLVTMYVVDVVARIAGGPHAIGPASAFHYAGSALVDGLDVPGFALLCAAGTLLAVGAAFLLERRDLRG